MRYYLTSLALNLCLICESAHAEIVTDPELEKSSQQIAQKESELYQFMVNDIYTAIDGNKVATQGVKRTTENSLTGNSGMGANLNTPEEQSFRNWSPSAQDLENMVKQGLQTGSLADQIKYYNEQFKVPKAIELTPADENSIIGNYGEFAATSTNASLSVADTSFDHARAITQQLNALYSLLGEQNTLKQSTNLNSAVNLKIIALQTELMRLRAQQLKMQALSQHENNTTRLEMMQFIEDIKD